MKSKGEPMSADAMVRCLCGAKKVPEGKVWLREEGMHYSPGLGQRTCETYSGRPILPGQPAPHDGWYEWGEMPTPPRFAWLGCGACYYGTSFGDCARDGEKARGRCDYWRPGYREAPHMEARGTPDPASTANATPGHLFPAENDPKSGEAA